MTPRRLAFFAVAAFAAGCAPAGGQYGASGTARTYGGTARTWGSGRSAEAPPFRGAKFTEIALPPGAPTACVSFSPDGKKVAAGSGTNVSVWAADTGKPITRVTYPQQQTGLPRLAFAADGNAVVTAWSDKPAVQSWDARTGAATKEWKTGSSVDGWVLALAPGGDRVLLRGPAGQNAHPVYDRDAKTPLSLVPPRDDNLEGVFSADGGSLAVLTQDRRLRLYEAKTGKVVWERAAGRTPTPDRSLAFSADGKHLLTNDIGPENRLHTAVYSVDDGRPVCRAPIFGQAALSTDNRVLVTLAVNTLHVYDLWTEREVFGYSPPSNHCLTLAASPDGKTLAVAGHTPGGQSLYLPPFPTLPPPVHPRADLSRDQVAEYWAALGSPNEFRRRYAASVFVARPDQTMVVAPERLTPVPDRDRLLVEDLVRNLADPDAAFRDRVAAELTHYVARFRPLLTAARDAAGPGPVRDRLTTALAATGPQPTELGAIEVLEGIGTPDARKLLAALAGGAKGATVTEAAAAGVKRLEGRK